MSPRVSIAFLLVLLCLIVVTLVIVNGDEFQRVPVQADSSPASSHTGADSGTEFEHASKHDMSSEGERGSRTEEADLTDSGLSAKAPETEVTFLVVDTRGAVIEGARLTEGSLDSSSVLGVTNAQGLCLVEWSRRGESLELVVRAEGFTTERAVVNVVAGRRVQIVLHELETISGFVRTPDDEPVADAIVYAIPSSKMTTLTQSEVSEFLAQPLRLVTKSDVYGAFRLEGVIKGTRYHLSCAVPGSLCTTPDHRARSGKENVLLQVEPAYGAVVRFVQTNGALLGPRNGTQGSVGARGADLSLVRQHAVTSLISIGLLGPLPTLTEGDLVVFAKSAEASGAAKTARVTRRFPGFDAVDVEVELAPAVPPLHEVVLPLGPGPAGFGTVKIDFNREVDQRAVHTGMAGAPATLLLESQEPGAETLKLPFRGREGSTTVQVDDIPHGVYNARVVSGLQATPYRSESVTLRVGKQPARLPVTGGDTGVVEFVGTGEAGRTDPGALVISIGRPIPKPGLDRDGFELLGIKSQTWLAFTEGPRRIPFLPPGDYGVAMDEPGFSFNGREWALFTIRTGELTTVEYSTE